MAVVAVGTVAHVHPSRARLRPILVNKLVEVEMTPYIIIHLHAHLIVGHVDVGCLAHGVLSMPKRIAVADMTNSRRQKCRLN